LIGWQQTLRERQAELQQGVDPGASLGAERDALNRFVDTAVDASDTLVDDIDDAGVPDIENGAEVADTIRTAFEDTRGKIEDAQDKVADIPVDSPGDYRAAADQFVADLRTTLEGIGGRLDDVDAPELESALDEASACQAG
jgi:hypothetical protein